MCKSVQLAVHNKYVEYFNVFEKNRRMDADDDDGLYKHIHLYSVNHIRVNNNQKANVALIKSKW